jgi:hypothetical protein
MDLAESEGAGGRGALVRRALVIGINDYDSCSALGGCVSDATRIAEMLEANGDGSPNFDVRLLTSDKDDVSGTRLNEEMEELFAAKADVALFYFAGHGVVAPNGHGHLVARDGRPSSWGIALTDLIATANKAHEKQIGSSIIILDSCQSGVVGEASGILGQDVAAVGRGVIVLSASHKEGFAAEIGGKGVFSNLVVEALRGAGADILGNVTPASVYSLVDQALNAWAQRPEFKANVQGFVWLRKVPPRVPLETLRRLPEWFPEETYVFPLDPSFEPDRENVPEKHRHIPVNEDNARVFKQLQKCNRFGLVVPQGVEHMYDAAMESTGCRLTGLGAHYRQLALDKRF